MTTPTVIQPGEARRFRLWKERCRRIRWTIGGIALTALLVNLMSCVVLDAAKRIYPESPENPFIVFLAALGAGVFFVGLPVFTIISVVLLKIQGRREKTLYRQLSEWEEFRRMFDWAEIDQTEPNSTARVQLISARIRQIRFCLQKNGLTASHLEGELARKYTMLLACKRGSRRTKRSASPRFPSVPVPPGPPARPGLTSYQKQVLMNEAHDRMREQWLIERGKL